MLVHDGHLREAKKVRVRIGLGTRMIDLRELSRMDHGSVVEMDAACDEDVEMYVGGRLYARGQAVVVDGMLAVRISEIVSD